MTGTLDSSFIRITETIETLDCFVPRNDEAIGQLDSCTPRALPCFARGAREDDKNSGWQQNKNLPYVTKPNVMGGTRMRGDYREWSVASTVLAVAEERSHSMTAIPFGRRE
jgi:hypothetical protein